MYYINDCLEIFLIEFEISGAVELGACVMSEHLKPALLFLNRSLHGLHMQL